MSGKELKIACAHYLSSYLPLTENWIYRVIINHKKFRPIFLTRKIHNLNLFPIPDIVSLDKLPKWRQYFEIGFFVIFRYFILFRNACLKNNVRILHVHFGYHGAKMFGLSNKLKIPMVCSFYGDDAFAFVHQNKYKNLFVEADLILVLGKYMKSRLTDLGCNHDKLRIHHLGIDVDKISFRERILKPGQPVRFLIASSFLPKKGIDLALKALSKFAGKQKFSLDIIGDGPLKKELEELVISGGLSEVTTFHGYKPYDFFIDMATQCDVFIQASRTTEDNRKEGTPMAIVDTMATGAVVISTKHSDIPEMVVDGVTGFLAEENDLESLVATFSKLFNQLHSLSNMSRAGRKWVEQEFDAVKQTAKLEEYYLELINAAV